MFAASRSPAANIISSKGRSNAIAAGYENAPPMSAFVDLEYGDMAELTDKEKAALLKQWAAETEIELLEREYSKP